MSWQDELEEQRQAVAADLREMGRREERLRDLDERLTGFEADAYENDKAFLAEPAQLVAETMTDRCKARAENGLRAIGEARKRMDASAAAVAEAEPSRALWAEIDEKRAEQARVEDAAVSAERRARQADNDYVTVHKEIAALRRPSRSVRWRNRRAVREARDRLDRLRAEHEALHVAADSARGAASNLRRRTEPLVAELSRRIVLSREEIRHRDAEAAWDAKRLSELEQAHVSTRFELERLQTLRAAVQAAQERVAYCTRRGWPGAHAEATALRREVARDAARRTATSC